MAASCSGVPAAPPAQGLAQPAMSCAHGREMPLRNLASPSPASPPPAGLPAPALDGNQHLILMASGAGVVHPLFLWGHQIISLKKSAYFLPGDSPLRKQMGAGAIALGFLRTTFHFAGTLGCRVVWTISDGQSHRVMHSNCICISTDLLTRILY